MTAAAPCPRLQEGPARRSRVAKPLKGNCSFPERIFARQLAQKGEPGQSRNLANTEMPQTGGGGEAEPQPHSWCGTGCPGGGRTAQLEEFALKERFSPARTEMSFAGVVQHVMEMWEMWCPHSQSLQRENFSRRCNQPPTSSGLRGLMELDVLQTKES